MPKAPLGGLSLGSLSYPTQTAIHDVPPAHDKLKIKKLREQGPEAKCELIGCKDEG
ncbi:hypothetical protein [Rhizobium leguminosarum]|uniref:hypothetical protein n=1 Tax=Rhizobium leguminosarum TaxID=384 RepID=UPI0013E3C8C8|nr:hypothetical protein [Rhizobium leguminosarum]